MKLQHIIFYCITHAFLAAGMPCDMLEGVSSTAVHTPPTAYTNP